LIAINCPHCKGKINIKNAKREPVSAEVINVEIFDDNGKLVATTTAK